MAWSFLGWLGGCRSGLGAEVGKTGNQSRQNGALILTVLTMWFVFNCMLFVLYYQGEKSSKNVEKSCFCHSRDWKSSRLSKILANGGSCFQLSWICSFPKVPHLLCCRAGVLNPVSYYTKKMMVHGLPNHIAENGQRWEPRSGDPAAVSSPFSSLCSVYKLVCQTGHTPQFSSLIPS